MFSEANINVKNAFLMKEHVRSKPLVFLYIRKIIHCVKSGNNYVIIVFLLSRHHFISKTNTVLETGWIKSTIKKFFIFLANKHHVR